MNTSRSLLGSLFLAGMLAACSSDPEVENGSSSGASGTPGADGGSSGSTPPATGLKANETWDVVVGDNTGAVTITDSRVDFRVGEFSALVELSGANALTMTWTESGETKTYTGTRKAGSAPFDLGVTKVALEGEWTLQAGAQTFSASITPDRVQLGCVGACTQGTDAEGIDIVRTTSTTGELGIANGTWDAVTQPTETEASVRIAGNSIVIDSPDARFSATWANGRMAGTVTEDQVEFSAQKR